MSCSWASEAKEKPTPRKHSPFRLWGAQAKWNTFFRNQRRTGRGGEGGSYQNALITRWDGILDNAPGRYLRNGIYIQHDSQETPGQWQLRRKNAKHWALSCLSIHCPWCIKWGGSKAEEMWSLRAHCREKDHRKSRYIRNCLHRLRERPENIDSRQWALIVSLGVGRGRWTKEGRVYDGGGEFLGKRKNK